MTKLQQKSNTEQSFPSWIQVSISGPWGRPEEEKIVGQNTNDLRLLKIDICDPESRLKINRG
jgi:hypothetical protein